MVGLDDRGGKVNIPFQTLQVGDLVRRKNISSWRAAESNRGRIAIVLSLQMGGRNPPQLVATVFAEGQIWDISEALIEVAK